MKILAKRWGEVTIKKQGEGKNKFDQTKSFSIEKTKYEYSIEELKTIFKMMVNLTQKYNYLEIKQIFSDLMEKNENFQ